VPCGPSKSQKHEKACRTHVRPTHERVFPSNPGYRGYHNGFSAPVLCHWEVQKDGYFIITLGHGIVIVTKVEFSKRWETSSAHPVLEVFVIAELRDIGRIVSIREPERPVWWWDNFRQILVSGGVCVLLGFTGP